MLEYLSGIPLPQRCIFGWRVMFSNKLGFTLRPKYVEIEDRQKPSICAPRTDHLYKEYFHIFSKLNRRHHYPPKQYIKYALYVYCNTNMKVT